MNIAILNGYIYLIERNLSIKFIQNLKGSSKFNYILILCDYMCLIFYVIPFDHMVPCLYEDILLVQKSDTICAC